VTSQKETILSECADMIRNNETEKLQLMFKLMDRVPDEGITPMLNDLEAHIRASGIADMVRLEQKELTCGLYYKHVTIVNYASSGVNKLRASLNDDA
jgi:Cullin family